ncbi:putative holin-like toxin [Listeria monocytogenes]
MDIQTAMFVIALISLVIKLIDRQKK